MRINPAFRRGLESMDHVDLRVFFCVMKCVPAFMKGSYRNAMRLTLHEADRAPCGHRCVGLSRAWKAFLLLPRMLLHRHPRGGLIAKSSLIERLQSFKEGNWTILLDTSVKCAEQASQASRCRRRRQDDEIAKRADRAQSLVQMGELSAARQALEGAAVAPGTEATRAALTDPAKRPPAPREPLPRHLAEAVTILILSCSARI